MIILTSASNSFTNPFDIQPFCTGEWRFTQHRVNFSLKRKLNIDHRMLSYWQCIFSPLKDFPFGFI